MSPQNPDLPPTLDGQEQGSSQDNLTLSFKLPGITRGINIFKLCMACSGMKELAFHIKGNSSRAFFPLANPVQKNTYNPKGNRVTGRYYEQICLDVNLDTEVVQVLHLRINAHTKLVNISLGEFAELALKLVLGKNANRELLKQEYGLYPELRSLEFTGKTVKNIEGVRKVVELSGDSLID